MDNKPSACVSWPGFQAGWWTVLLALALRGLALQAQVPIYDASNRSHDHWGMIAPISSAKWWAQSFRVPADGAYRLTSVRVDISGSGGGLGVDVYTNGSGNVPGESLLSLQGPSNPSGPSTYSPATPLFLAAAQIYWIVARVEDNVVALSEIIPIPDPNPGSGSIYVWTGSASAAEVGTDIGSAYYESGTWAWTSGGLALTVYGTAVPEPSAWGLVGLTLALGVAVRKRLPRRR